MYIKNNLLLSIRHLRADKTNTSINLAGLILGLAIVSVVIVFMMSLQKLINVFIPTILEILRLKRTMISSMNQRCYVLKALSSNHSE